MRWLPTKKWAVYGEYADGKRQRMLSFWTERGARKFINWVVKNTPWRAWQIEDGAPALSVGRINELG